MGGILAQTLQVDDAVDWSSLLDESDLEEPKPTRPQGDSPPHPPRLPAEPDRSNPAYQPTLGVLDRMLSSRRAQKESEANRQYERAHATWVSEVQAAEAQAKRQKEDYR